MLSDDEQVIITVNGEIYNYIELREELLNKGYVFNSHSDSEVVLHGYRCWGIEELSKRIDGMYAFVVFDQQKNKLFCVRDRVGIKPLYYYYDGHVFSWASELKALEAWVPKERLVKNPEALLDFLAYRYVPAPKTLYQNVYKLQQSRILTFDLDNRALSIEQYWTLPTADSDVKEPESILRDLVLGSVKAQMVSDVPIGFLLSGGIDSSVITCCGAKIAKKPIGFSIGFKDKARDEVPYAAMVAKATNTQHNVKILESKDMENVSNQMRRWFDEPFADTSAIPTFLVSEFARDSVTVALSGDGGDELFGGYRWYKEFERVSVIRKYFGFFLPEKFLLPRFVPKRRYIYLASIKDPIERYGYLRAKINHRVLDKWKECLGLELSYDPFWAYRAYYDKSLGFKKLAQVLDFHTYLPDDILVKVDRTSMAVSLECRPPFLAKEVIEFAFKLKEQIHFKSGALKTLLKAAFEEELTNVVVSRSKQGFSVPDFGWKKKAGADQVTLQEAFISEFID